MILTDSRRFRGSIGLVGEQAGGDEFESNKI